MQIRTKFNEPAKVTLTKREGKMIREVAELCRQINRSCGGSDAAAADEACKHLLLLLHYTGSEFAPTPTSDR